MKRYFVLASLLLMSSPVLFSQGVDLKKGLVAYYPFNGNAIDESGRANHGKVTGAALTEDISGKKNSAYYFNGNSYITVPDNNSLDFGSAFSVFSLINLEDISQDQKILSKVAPYSYQGGYILGIDKSMVYPEIFNDLNKRYGGKNGIELKSNTWYQVGFTFNNNSIKYYCDGNLIYTMDVPSGSIGNNFNDLIIGANSWEKPPKNLKVRGKIDEVRLYNRALNDQEILALYKLQVPEVIEPPVITWENPLNSNFTIQTETFDIKACIKSKKPLESLRIFINNSLYTDFIDRGYNVVNTGSCNVNLVQSVLLTEGVNEIKIIASSAGGTSVSETRTIICQALIKDIIAPVITLIEPMVQRGFKMTEEAEMMTIIGKATDESGILEVSVNGNQISVQTDGIFRTKIALGTGENTILIKATDTKYNVSEFSFYVQCKSKQIVIQENIISNENRIALVIGNAAYTSAPLRNPVNDANVIAEELGKLGFKVTKVVNGSQTEMKKAISDYGTALGNDRSSVGLFYYAGHGIQARGKNYLIPTDAHIEKEADVEVYCVDLDNVLGNLEYADNNLNMIILDACRNNPFGRGFRSQASSGLATVNAPSGTIIAFATAPGSTAADGEGNNGLYTQEFVKALQMPNTKIEDVFKSVRKQVKALSDGKQIPWENSALEGDFYFRKL